MNDREALIQSIIDSPDDDTPRLVYADWQEEHGDPAHAELIRVQCRLARLPNGDMGRKSLAGREAELLARPENAALTARGNSFTRGMVETARWYHEVDRFDADGTPLEHPLFVDGVPLERVLIVDGADFGDSNWPDDSQAIRIAAAPAACRIRRVAFHEFAIEGSVVRALAAAPQLTNLREVVFSDAVTEPAALAELVLNPSVRGVEILMLQGETNGWDGMGEPLSRILADPRTANMRRLYLLALGLPPETADALLQAKGLEGPTIWVSERIEWLTPSLRTALRAKFGERLQFEPSWFINPYSYGA